ncbi:adenosylcobinamide-phosphate synthase CbiB [Pseudoduganella danionis]|uniref:Cobalamin biosynthesis protein CobD n=1 Tax=Pseudoduganella danionis TaxID=1890295 RepID=A0ABW9STI7_9BURK|nr:cobalamin biosynthesis protein [Pseudoduganella danionis]
MLTGLHWSAITLLLTAGALLDLLLGEVRRWHPLVGFGNLAYALERRLNQGALRFCRGVLAWLLAVIPITAAASALTWWLAPHSYALWACHAVLLYFSLGLRSLGEHNLPIATALAQQDLAQARQLTARIVSRDTSKASEQELTRASIESLLENGNDAVFGTLFWFMLAGGPGAVMYRMANTLDAMWGYRTERLRQFGCCAARMDDALNYLPARLTALSYTVLAPTLSARRRAWRCWRQQAPAWDSPNAGPVMASGAGALGIKLGGAAIYHGVLEQRPQLGDGASASGPDIFRAWRLVSHTTLLWLTVAVLINAAQIWSQHA